MQRSQKREKRGEGFPFSSYMIMRVAFSLFTPQG